MASWEEEPTPTHLYESGHKALRRRLFPCPACGDPADGAHQCGVCFLHIHTICSEPFPGTEEGYGQLRLCMECEPPEAAENVYNEDNSDSAADNASNEDDTDVLDGQDRRLEEGPDCGPGTYRKQRLDACQIYMRANGLKPLAKACIVPKLGKIDEATIPTFYADESQKEIRKKARDHLLASIAANTNDEEASSTFEDANSAKDKKRKKKRKKRTEANATMNNDILEAQPRKKKKKRNESTKAVIVHDAVTEQDNGSIEEQALLALKEGKKRRVGVIKTTPFVDSSEDVTPLPTHRKKNKKRKGMDMQLAKEIAQLVFQKQKADDKRKKVYKKRLPTKKANIRLRNWVAAMRRNLRDDEKDKALSQFTISRLEIHKVQTEPFCVYR